jgi:hypothetical protein
LTKALFAKNHDPRTAFFELGHNDQIEEGKNIVE